MKLVFVTQVIDSGDAILGFVVRWVQGLAKVCERVRVIALEEGDISGLPDNVDVRIIGRRGSFRRLLRYRRHLSEAFGPDGFDTLLTHMVPRYSNLAAGRARRFGVGHYLWYTHKGVDARLRNAVRAVDKVFTASAESMRVSTPKKVVTGHGIDLEHFDARGEKPDEPPRLFAAGRMTPAKDPLTLIAALSILVSRGHDLRLDWAGAGLASGDAAFERTVHEVIADGGLADRVELLGDVPYPDIPAWFRRATVFVSASHTGSVDKVVLEAMATARPVVTCNEAFPAIFEELGDEADLLTFEKGSASQLADRIETLLEMNASERFALGMRLRWIVQRDHEVDALMARLFHEMGGVVEPELPAVETADDHGGEAEPEGRA